MNPTFEATIAFDTPAGVGVPAAPLRFPAWMRRLLPFARIPDAMRDRSTGLYNRPGLIAAANEILDAMPEGTAATMIVVEFSDLREVCDIYGRSTARKIISRVVSRLERVAGMRGVVGRTAKSQFTLLVPIANRDALERLHSALGKPARIELDAGDNEIVLVPDLLVDTVEPGDATAQELYRRMCRELSRIQASQQRRLEWMASQRERHSRPMSLPAL